MMRKYLVMMMMLLVVSATFLYAELVQPDNSIVPAENNLKSIPVELNTVLRGTAGTRAPEFSFHINPVPIMATYYDYFPGSYDSIPLRVQPSPVGIYDGGGVYITFQSTPEAGGVRRVYYAYLSDGVITSQGLVNPQAPANRAEGFTNIDLDMETGNPVFSWHTGSNANPAILECPFTFDQYSVIGFPGLLNQAYPVIRNPYSVNDEDDNEFIWPSIFVGHSPTEGMKRVYVMGRNRTNNAFDVQCDNMMIAFADYTEIDELSVYDSDQWSYITVPQLDNWRALNYRPYQAAVVSRETGYVAIGGHKRDANEGSPPHSENDLIFVLENRNFGEGEWTLFTTDPTIEIENPRSPIDSLGFFKQEGGEPFEDLRYKPLFNRHNLMVDDQGNYHFLALYGLTNEGGTYWPDYNTTKYIRLDTENGQFDIRDFYPLSGTEHRYVPWGTPPRFSEDGENIYISRSYPIYWWNLENAGPFHENYHRMISKGKYMVALFQESRKTRIYHTLNAESYASWASAPETFIYLSKDYGVNWSEPIVMNANPFDAQPDEDGIFHGNYVAELDGMIPSYWYIADEIEMLEGDWGRIHLMFLDQNDYGSSIHGNSTPSGGTITYTAIDVNFNFTGEVGIDKDDVVDLPVTQTVQLRGNYPNPFNPVTTISYELARDTKIRLEVYNVKGQLVKTLVDGQVRAGQRYSVWNGTDDNGREVGSGVYFYKLTTEDTSITKKMLLVK